MKIFKFFKPFKLSPLYIVIALIVLLAFLRLYPAGQKMEAEEKSFAMGTPLRVKVFGANASALAKAAIDEIKRLDKIFSRFDPESEVSLINKNAAKSAQQVSPETMECIKIAVRVNQLSKGAFDITLGKPQSLVVNEDLMQVYLNEKSRIDLGGIGKGYAVESARRLLLKKGAKSGIIDMRSSIAVFGPRTWKIGIQHPRQKEKLVGTIILRNGQSLATSGDYERGKHILDPRTGKSSDLCQGVTIIGENAAEADALATASFVLGPEDGIDMLNGLKEIDGIIIDSNGQVIKSSAY
jgi:thiamine biosynthesis lipoprotein